MASGKIPKKTIIWQDIRPANKTPQINPEQKKISKITRIFICAKKPWLQFNSSIKHFHKNISKFKTIKRKTKILVSLLITTSIIVGGIFIIKTNYNDKHLTTNGVKVEDLAAKNPEYQTFLPNGKKISDLGGWQRVSPNDRVAVFAYIDEIDNVKINVSQQKLPEDFEQNTATQIAELAKSFKADQKMAVDNIEAYIGTSIKGPQSVIFVKNQTLILIKSSSKIENASWSSYIKSLQ